MDTYLWMKEQLRLNQGLFVNWSLSRKQNYVTVDLRVKVLSSLISHPLMFGPQISGKPDHQEESG